MSVERKVNEFGKEIEKLKCLKETTKKIWIGDAASAPNAAGSKGTRLNETSDHTFPGEEGGVCVEKYSFLKSKNEWSWFSTTLAPRATLQ